ncbi:transposase [Streptomyces sp. NPDC005529]|uniref:transposase n=1 Tax=unclassified Streptomyces TaxID=2593676 RepID=UPI0033A9D7F4
MRRHVWSLQCLRPGGFPWLSVAGRRPKGWIVIDLDATVITTASKKERAAVTFKKTFGFHPLAAWRANTDESQAMLLRPGNAGGQHRGRPRHRTHRSGMEDDRRRRAGHREAPRGRLGDLSGEGRNAARGLFPGRVDRREHAGELGGRDAADRAPGQTVRTAARKRTAFEKQTCWRYSITAANIRHMWGIVGSRQPQFLEVLHRSHAGVEDRVRTNKAMSLHDLPSNSWEVNRG